MTTEFIGLWQKRLAETDINQVREEVAAVNPYTARSYLVAGESVIREYEEKQEEAIFGIEEISDVLGKNPDLMNNSVLINWVWTSSRENNRERPEFSGTAYS